MARYLSRNTGESGKLPQLQSLRYEPRNTITVHGEKQARIFIRIEPRNPIGLRWSNKIKDSRPRIYFGSRFSKWPTAQICKNTVSRTVVKFLTKYCSDYGTPRGIRTDNGSCFKSNEYKDFCDRENIKRIRCTPSVHTCTGQVERTIRTIKSLTRANMADGSIFEESVDLAIETIRQTPHSKLNMTPFQMHFGRKPRTAITNLIGQPECLLSNWKKTPTNYISDNQRSFKCLL